MSSMKKKIFILIIFLFVTIGSVFVVGKDVFLKK